MGRVGPRRPRAAEGLLPRVPLVFSVLGTRRGALVPDGQPADLPFFVTPEVDRDREPVAAGAKDEVLNLRLAGFEGKAVTAVGQHKASELVVAVEQDLVHPAAGPGLLSGVDAKGRDTGRKVVRPGSWQRAAGQSTYFGPGYSHERTYMASK